MTKNGKGHEASGAAPQVLTFGSPEIGEILAERYKIEAHVGDDSAGRQLYQGIDVILRRPVMIVLRYPGGDAASEMLAAAVSASRVVHPHLAGVYDAIDEGERAYVVREWIDGVSLREALADGPLDPGRAVAIAWAVADAVAALHGTGVAHGNVHPGSVMIAPDGRVMLADARADEDATHAGDVRAVAGLLYCALTGFWPHAEAGQSRMPDGIHEADGTLVSPRQVRNDISTELDELIAALLDPQVQPPAAETLAAELAELSDEVEAETFEGPLDFAAGFDAVSSAPAGRATPDRRRLFLIAAALVVIALIGTIAATQFSTGSDNGAQPSAKASAPKSSKGPTSNQPKPLQISATQLRIVDAPHGSRSDGELIRNVDKMVDGDSSTAWRTEGYLSSPAFGNLKAGVGVLIDLGSPQQVVGVQAEMVKAGVTMELKYGDIPTNGQQDGDSAVFNSYKSVGPAPVVAGKTVVFPGPDQPTRYVMIWLSQLVLDPSNGKYYGGIEELSVTVR